MHNSTVPRMSTPETSGMRFGLMLLLALFIPTPTHSHDSPTLGYLTFVPCHQGRRPGVFRPRFWRCIWVRGRSGTGHVLVSEVGKRARSCFRSNCECCLPRWAHWSSFGGFLCRVEHWGSHEVWTDSGKSSHEATAANAANKSKLPIPLVVLWSLVLAGASIEVFLRIRFLYATRAMKHRLFKSF